MTEEVSCLKLQLREKEEEIAALRKRLEQLEKVRRSTSRSFIPWKVSQVQKEIVNLDMSLFHCRLILADEVA